MEIQGTRQVTTGKTTIKVKYGLAFFPYEGSFYLAPHVTLETVRRKRGIDKRKAN